MNGPFHWRFDMRGPTCVWWAFCSDKDLTSQQTWIARNGAEAHFLLIAIECTPKVSSLVGDELVEVLHTAVDAVITGGLGHKFFGYKLDI